MNFISNAVFSLANSTKMCYTYDNLSRVTKRTVKNLSDVVLSEEEFTYDAAGNITDAPDSCFSYTTNNRLVVFKGNPLSFDLDDNMLFSALKRILKKNSFKCGVFYSTPTLVVGVIFYTVAVAVFAAAKIQI